MSASVSTIGTSSIQPKQRSLLASVWDFLTKPSVLVTEPDRRQQARFVSAVLAFLLIASSILILRAIIVSIGAWTTSTFIYVVLIAIESAVYGLSRTKHTEIAVNFYLASSIGLLFLILLSNPTTTTGLYWMTVPILFAGMILSLRNTAIMVVAIAALLLSARVVLPQVDISGPANFVIVFCGTVLVFVWFRNLLENTRKGQLTDSLQKVETLNRTLVQTNQELVKANALARESARLKSEFMSTMSHELRTPLNAMLGFSGILIEGMGGELDEDARHMVERIDSNSKRLLTLINDVLDIAKIEAGRLELVSLPISPRNVVNTWKSQMGVLADQKKLALITEIDPALPDQLYGDVDRLSQIAVNLLSNAIKFTETGSVKLSLKSQGDMWLLEVTDTGIGIPPQAINYIFDEFRQLDGSSTRAYGGSGLGLAIVRNLCRMMGGSIQVTSKMGEGSTFTAKLPLQPVVNTESVVAQKEGVQ